MSQNLLDVGAALTSFVDEVKAELQSLKQANATLSESLEASKAQVTELTNSVHILQAKTDGAETAITALQTSRQQTIEGVAEQGRKIEKLITKEKSALEVFEEIYETNAGLAHRLGELEQQLHNHQMDADAHTEPRSPYGSSPLRKSQLSRSSLRSLIPSPHKVGDAQQEDYDIKSASPERQVPTPRSRYDYSWLKSDNAESQEPSSQRSFVTARLSFERDTSVGTDMTFGRTPQANRLYQRGQIPGGRSLKRLLPIKPAQSRETGREEAGGMPVGRYVEMLPLGRPAQGIDSDRSDGMALVPLQPQQDVSEGTRKKRKIANAAEDVLEGDKDAQDGVFKRPELPTRASKRSTARPTPQGSSRTKQATKTKPALTAVVDDVIEDVEDESSDIVVAPRTQTAQPPDSNSAEEVIRSSSLDGAHQQQEDVQPEYDTPHPHSALYHVPDTGAETLLTAARSDDMAPASSNGLQARETHSVLLARFNARTGYVQKSASRATADTATAEAAAGPGIEEAEADDREAISLEPTNRRSRKEPSKSESVSSAGVEKLKAAPTSKKGSARKRVSRLNPTLEPEPELEVEDEDDDEDATMQNNDRPAHKRSAKSATIGGGKHKSPTSVRRGTRRSTGAVTERVQTVEAAEADEPEEPEETEEPSPPIKRRLRDGPVKSAKGQDPTDWSLIPKK